MNDLHTHQGVWLIIHASTVLSLENKRIKAVFMLFYAKKTALQGRIFDAAPEKNMLPYFIVNFFVERTAVNLKEPL
jgi:hypothetical protein